MEWLLTREAVVLIAVLGAVPAVAASVLEVRGVIDAARANQLNMAGYILMGLSMALFIIAGFRAA